jgi:hypothetical protein
MINVGEINHSSVGSIKLEISNDDLFVKRVKEINREIKDVPRADRMKLWKIRVIGEGRIPAKIQHLIDGSEDTEPPEETTQDLRTPVGNGIAVKPLGHTPPEDAKPARRPRPGGPLNT